MSKAHQEAGLGLGVLVCAQCGCVSLSCPRWDCSWQARAEPLHTFPFESLYRNDGSDGLKGREWHICLMCCCLFVCKCQQATVLLMILHRYDLIPPERCLCVSVSVTAVPEGADRRWQAEPMSCLWCSIAPAWLGMCSSPTDAAKQKLIMDTVFSVDLMDYKMHVQNTLFHHFYVCTYSFLFSASEPPCCWFDVISLTWTKRYIIHIYEKSMNFRSKKLGNTIFCVCSDKINLPSFILEDSGSLPW